MKNPGNYRGITLHNIVGELNTKLSTSRLSEWLQHHDKSIFTRLASGANAAVLTMFLAYRTLYRSAPGRDSQRGCSLGVQLGL